MALAAAAAGGAAAAAGAAAVVGAAAAGAAGGDSIGWLLPGEMVENSELVIVEPCKQLCHRLAALSYSLVVIPTSDAAIEDNAGSCCARKPVEQFRNGPRMTKSANLHPVR